MIYYYMTNMTPEGVPSKHGIGFRFKATKEAAYELADHLKVIVQEAGVGEAKPFKPGDPPKKTVVVLGYDVDRNTPCQIELSFGLHGKADSKFLQELVDALNATETKVSVIKPIKDGKFYTARITQAAPVTKPEIVEASFNSFEVVSKKAGYLDSLPEPAAPEVVEQVELNF